MNGAVTGANGFVGATFLVTDGEDLSTARLVRSLAEAMGVSPRLLPVPRSLLLLGAALIGRRAAMNRLIGSLQFDSSRIRTRLQWSPPFTVTQGLAETARWFVQGGDSRAV